MFSIKNSYANCKSCPLLEAPSTFIETNSKENLRDVDTIFVSNHPEIDDAKGRLCEGIKFPPGSPLIGPTGQVFRKVFNKTIIPSGIKYLITNSILCVTPKDDDKISKHCSPNLERLIEICRPKLIVALGSAALKAMINEDFHITNDHGKIFTTALGEWPQILLCIHPSYVVTNGGLDSEWGNKFESAFETALDFLNDSLPKSDIITEKVENPYMYMIPEKYYSNEYRLVDIQYISMQRQLVFIFRDRNNKKEIFTPQPKDTEYYWYEPDGPGVNKLVEPISNLVVKVGKYGDRNSSESCYESDRKPAEKHAVDYYLQSQGECPITSRNVLFFDIEIYTYKNKGFPSIEDAEYPICAISFALDNNESQMFLLDLPEADPILKETAKKYEDRVTVFTDERQLISAWITKLHDMNPDFLAGWNTNGFDFPYIFHRMKSLNMDAKLLSPVRNIWIDRKYGTCDITGYIPIDMLVIYKNLTYSNESSYKLQSIAQKVLKHGKQEYHGSLNEQYESHIDTLIKYSLMDTQLLQELDEALGHISLQDELRKAATTTHHGASSTIGLVDGLFNHELKSSGLVMKNCGTVHDRGTLVGAYVRQPEGGIYDWVIDFDYTSLYPSIICSFNIGPNTYHSKITQEESHLFIFNREKFKTQFSGQIILDPIYNKDYSRISADEFIELVNSQKLIVTPNGCIYLNHNTEKSYFYHIIKKLFAQRKAYKKLMFESKQAGDDTNRKLYNNMQMSYKILLNSLYGVLAQEHFRFFNIDLASTVTIGGQELIKFAGEHVDSWMEDHKNKSINPDFARDVESKKTYLKYCDTDSLFLHMEPYMKKLGKECNAQSVSEACEEIGDFLNTKLLRAYAILHNIDILESMFDIKNELICKRYFALNTKKKYALHVVSNERVDTDEIEIKGLEIRRSDYSELTREMLTRLIDMIMKSDEVSITKIQRFVDKVKDLALRSIEEGDPSLFRTVAFTKSLKEYKVIPQHIKGMTLWNLLEYDHFRMGDRGVLVPIKGIDKLTAPDNVVSNLSSDDMKQYQLKDLNVIVIPEEIEKIPPYYIVDIPRTLKFAIDDRVELLLQPLIKPIVNSQLRWE